MKLSIIIVNWNAKSMLPACLNSVSRAIASLDAELFVVDNASTDGSQAYLRQHWHHVNLILSDTNHGFAHANNLAAEQAQGEYLLLLNPDTEVRADSFTKLIAYAEMHPSIGVVGPRIENSDGSLQRSCWRGYPGLGMALSDALYLWKLPALPLVRQSEYRVADLERPRIVDHLLGAAMLIRRTVWETVGPLDDSFFIFLEETDWCLRAQKAGWEIAYYPGATIMHHGQHSMRQQPARNLSHLYRSYCHFYRKHFPRRRAGVVLLKLIFVEAAIIRIGLWLLRSIRSKSAESREQAQSMIHGYWHVIRQIPSY